MSRWAFMSGDSIVALLDGEPDDWPDLRDAGMLRPCGEEVPVGWVWDGEAFVPPAPPVGPRIITPLDFRRRFTDAERAAITLAASRGLDRGDATLQVWLDDLNSATEVDMDLPEVAAALVLLVAAKLVTTARVTVLLG
jgi:hypothetical protein